MPDKKDYDEYVVKVKRQNDKGEDLTGDDVGSGGKMALYQPNTTTLALMILWKKSSLIILILRHHSAASLVPVSKCLLIL